jgi:protein-L-isoaspartate(D-aspartate) O-methyltransferase
VARWFQALARRIGLMPQPATLKERRRRYAAEAMRSTGADNARVEEAFAMVPREDFLTPPPWRVFSPGGVVERRTSNPADLYEDVLVVLDRARGINNGQPSLHAAWISAVDPQPGETAVHIGAGAGYYTAIIAILVEPGGEVHAYEIDNPLARLARRHLARFPHVTVYATTGVGVELPGSDVIYVNAGATAPDATWLRSLKPRGRLIFPWQPMGVEGITLLVRRTEAGFQALPTMAVGFISCVGAQAPPRARCGPHDLMETRSVWLTADREPDTSATGVYDEVWFSSDPV